MAGQSQGAFSALAIDGFEYCFTRIEALGQHEITDPTDETICGKLDGSEERVQGGLKRLIHRVYLDPTPNELDKLLLLSGFEESPTDTFSNEDSSEDSIEPTAFTMIIDRVAMVHTYTGSKIMRWAFTGQKGSRPVGLILDIYSLAVTEAAAGSFSASAITADVNYALFNGALTIQGETREFDRFLLDCNFHPEVEYNNSQTPTSIHATKRTTKLAVNTPYTQAGATAEEDLFTTPAITNTHAGATGTLVLTRSDVSKSTTFTFGNLKPIVKPPSVQKKQLRLPLTYNAYRTGSTESLVITHDATT